MRKFLYDLEIYQGDIIEHWDKISFGHDLPSAGVEDFDVGAMVDAAEALRAVTTIWLSVLSSNIRAHPLVIESAFYRSLDGSSERGLSYDVFRDIALDAGVDYMIDAWFDGVPLEYILEDEYVTAGWA